MRNSNEIEITKNHATKDFENFEMAEDHCSRILQPENENLNYLKSGERNQIDILICAWVYLQQSVCAIVFAKVHARACMCLIRRRDGKMTDCLIILRDFSSN